MRDLSTNTKPGQAAPSDKPRRFSFSYDPPNVATMAQVTQAFEAIGAQPGDLAHATFSLPLQNMRLTAEVTAQSQVTVLIRNDTLADINLAAGTLRLFIWPQ